MAGGCQSPGVVASDRHPEAAAEMSRRSAAVLWLGVGFIAADLFKIGTALVLARWDGKRLRADEL